MKRVADIFFLSACLLSCKQKSVVKKEISIQKEITNLENPRYFFGLDNVATIDSNMTVPDSESIYNDRLQRNVLFSYNKSTASMCFKNDDTLFLKAEYNTENKNVSYALVKVYAKYDPRYNADNAFDYHLRFINVPPCGDCWPGETLIGKRLLLDKPHYEVNDTVSGKLFLKYYVDNYCSDSANRFKIEIDSLTFKYKLYSASEALINNFETDSKTDTYQRRK